MMQVDELSRLFAAERAVRAPATAVEQGLTRLLTDVAAQAAPLPVAAGALKLTAVGVSKWVMAGFVVGMASSGAASLVTSANMAGSEPFSVPSVAATVASPIASAKIARAPEPAVAASVAVPPLAERPVARVAGSTTVESRDAVPFDAELRLITAAKAELDAGRVHLANVWLDEHAARFPRGVFSTDRDGLRVLARCAEHRDEALARAFAAQHPGSPMNPRLLRACQARTAADFGK